MKHSSRVSLKCCGKDVVAVPENSTLLEISKWSWGWCVQTKKTSRSSMRCTGRCVGKGFREIMAVLRSWCGMELWRSSKATSTWSKCDRTKETAFTHRQHGDRARMECAVGLHHVEVEVRRSLHLQWRQNMGLVRSRPDAEPNKGIRSYRAAALTSVMSKWSCIILRLKKKNLRAGRDCTWEGLTGWGWRDKLPAPASYDDEFAAETLGVAGVKDSHVEAWQRVFGKLGHQDGVRWGKTEARRKNYGKS